jgi:hypothetical protein
MIDSVDEFIRLRYSDDPNEYRRAASEPAALEVWLELIEQHPDSRVWVARNKTVPVEVLSILAGDPSPDVRFAVSTKRKLTPELLERLADDPDESVRLQVARHQNTPKETLERLGQDDWENVASVVAERLGHESQEDR